MSPVEPSPVAIGAIGLPSTADAPDWALLLDTLSAFSLAGESRLPATTPRVDKKERRFQPDFKFIRLASQLPLQIYARPVWSWRRASLLSLEDVLQREL